MAGGPVSRFLNSVVFVSVQNDKGEFIERGTAFFVAVPQGTQGRSFPHLVTAKHVLTQAIGELYESIFIRMNLKSGGFEIAKIDLKSATRYLHDDPSVDLVAIPAAATDETCDIAYISSNMILTRQLMSEFELAVGDEVFFTGLFRYRWRNRRQVDCAV